MIRAGRQHLVRTLADLAAEEGLTLGYYRKKRAYKEPGHPKPISSPTSRVLLYDGAQTDAYRASEPVPALPTDDLPDDLLDLHEAAALVDLAPRSWEVHKNGESLARHVVLVRGKNPPEDLRGVEHWPRRAVLAWKADRPGTGHTRGGRTVGALDVVPRLELPDRVQHLLVTRPDITAAQVEQQLGIHHDTASRVLVDLRRQGVRRLLDKQPDLTPEDVVEQAGYRLRNAGNALTSAHAADRAAGYTPYITSVLEAARAADVAISNPTGVTIRPGGICAAAQTLDAEKSAASGLIWDERYGWRTDPDPAVSCGRERTPPTGTGIRYLTDAITPDPADVVNRLKDRRTGYRRPRLVRTGDPALTSAGPTTTP
ncbi:hypothetical protein [Streptomyces sp. NPDC087294]|uniref:hypothetical protein n=1 Tax=Streptomyces sp. NPDC087294 TaxID=3365777 RepID=UPI00382645F1